MVMDTLDTRICINLKMILDLKKVIAEKDQKIVDLEMSLAFCELNTGADAMRVQCLEEQFDDLANAVAMMQDKLCTCETRVHILFLRSWSILASHCRLLRRLPLILLGQGYHWSTPLIHPIPLHHLLPRVKS